MTVNQDDELTALRAQRMNELQSQIQQQAAKQLEAEEQAQQEATDAARIDAVLRRLPIARSSCPTRPHRTR